VYFSCIQCTFHALSVIVVRLALDASRAETMGHSTRTKRLQADLLLHGQNHTVSGCPMTLSVPEVCAIDALKASSVIVHPQALCSTYSLQLPCPITITYKFHFHHRPDIAPLIAHLSEEFPLPDGKQIVELAPGMQASARHTPQFELRDIG
jgi:hypothetical protein